MFVWSVHVEENHCGDVRVLQSIVQHLVIIRWTFLKSGIFKFHFAEANIERFVF